MERLEKIRQLLAQKLAIDGELSELKAQIKAEKAAFNTNRKPRKKPEA